MYGLCLAPVCSAVDLSDEAFNYLEVCIVLDYMPHNSVSVIHRQWLISIEEEAIKIMQQQPAKVCHESCEVSQYSDIVCVGWSDEVPYCFLL
jgi:hypothetical protein